MTREQVIVEVLSDYFREMSPERAAPSRDEANYTILALVCNRQIAYERAWQVPDTMMLRTGYGDPLEMCLELTHEQLEAAIRVRPCAHRLPSTMARLMKGTAVILADVYRFDARNLYHGERVEVVLHRLLALPGYGRKIARLALRQIVIDWSGDVVGSRAEVDAAPDVHVCRVLARLGLLASPDPDEAIRVARVLSPEAPYLVDGAFGLGISVCGARPRCDGCRLRDCCPSGRAG